MDKGVGIDKVILHLALQENKAKEFDFYSLLNQLSIPEDLHHFVLNTMFSRGYINGQASIRSPFIHITEQGLQYVEQLKQNHFLRTGQPLNPRTSSDMPLEETCEILFQMHKNDTFTHWWTKDSYNDKPSNLIAAKELLHSKGVLYSKLLPTEQISTHLNPDFYKTKTCKESLEQIAEQNKHKPSIHIDQSITTHGNNSPAAAKDLTFNQTNNPEPTKKKWSQKWVDEFIKNIVQFIVTGAILFLSGLITGESCNQATSKLKTQLNDPNILQNSSDTISLKNDDKG
jgi:hypothetical protein